MKTFRINEEGVGQLEYCVVKCHECGTVFRHDFSVSSFGKTIKNRMCQVCGAMVPIDERHCLDHDPMVGQFRLEFKAAKDL
jgi:hypothetical protein